MILLTEREFIQLLLEKISEAGSQKALAMELKIPVQYLDGVIQRKSEPRRAILHAVGFRRVVYYEKLQNSKQI